MGLSDLRPWPFLTSIKNNRIMFDCSVWLLLEIKSCLEINCCLRRKDQELCFINELSDSSSTNASCIRKMEIY